MTTLLDYHNYFNTVALRGQELSQKRQKAQSQEDIILAIFQKNRYILMSPEIVLAATGKNWPLTSVRRAMTCLTQKGRIRKTDVLTEGNYGHPVHLWVLDKEVSE